MAVVLALLGGAAHALSDAVAHHSPDDQYNEQRAMTFLQFSNAAYCGADKIDAWSCKPCLEADPGFNAVTFTDAKTQGQAFVGLSRPDAKTSSPAIVVGFRGSANLQNWLSDLHFPKMDAYSKCDGCRVHSGFFKAWEALAPGVVAEVLLLKAAAPAAQLFVTGHSLGAALAVLAASELHYSQNLTINAVYTYGLPRVGNEAFRGFYSNGSHVSWRVTHNRDPIPSLPPKELFGFRHIQQEVWYTENSSSYRLCNGSGEDPKCSDSVFRYNMLDHTSYLGVVTGGSSC